jgi:hypothetical protein
VGWERPRGVVLSIPKGLHGLGAACETWLAMAMGLFVILLLSGLSSLLALASVSLAVTGRNLPGILGRGLTQADVERLRRAPPIYYRALGSFVGVAAIDGFFLAWVISRLPTVSTGTLEMIAVGFAVLTVPTTGSAVWLFVLASRYRQFRWDKP